MFLFLIDFTIICKCKASFLTDTVVYAIFDCITTTISLIGVCIGGIVNFRPLFSKANSDIGKFSVDSFLTTLLISGIEE